MFKSTRLNKELYRTQPDDLMATGLTANAQDISYTLATRPVIRLHSTGSFIFAFERIINLFGTHAEAAS